MRSKVPCVFCKAFVINPSGTMNGWIHEGTRKAECRPTYAAPNFITGRVEE